MGSGIHKTTLKNINEILNLLKEVGEIHIRGISRALELNPFVVCNIINNYLIYFLEIRDINQFGIRIKLVKLKAGLEYTVLEDVLKYVQLKNRIRSK